MSLKKIVEKIFKRFSKDKKSLPQLNKEPYAQKVEMIDDLELGRMFEKSITPEIERTIKIYDENGAIYDYPLQTQISEQHTIEIAKRFFESIDDEISVKLDDIINENNLDIKLVMKPYDGKEGANASSPNPNNKPLRVFVPIRGDLRQLYELVHELTHTLDIDNGDTITRKILGEVAPQCFERMLDKFLLEMSDEEMAKYGFDKSVLEKDIQDRRITTFISRYHNTQALNRGRGNRVIDSRYMLAQIYSAHFNKFDEKCKRQKIKDFISCVRNDNFDGANNVFELQMDRNNKLQRGFYISDTMEEIRTIVVPKSNKNDLSIEKNINDKEQEKN